jgi:hypothetical protein
MAQEIVIKIKLDNSEASKKLKDDLVKAVNDAAQGAQVAGKKVGDAISLGVESGTRRARSEVAALSTALAAIGGLRVFKQIASDAIQAAVAIDRQVAALRAFTGSAQAATARFRELFQLAQQTPGLTTSLAATLDTQLRVFNVTQQTINRLLPVVGRLNAISPLGDPKQFVNNLTQLISQNFERADLKELVGQSPIAGKLIAQIFNVDNPTNAEAIRKAAKNLGVNTVERLAEELVKAAETNSALKNAQETLAGQFEKMKDRITVALAPIGDALIKTILPQMEKLVQLLEKDGPKIAAVLASLGDEIDRSASRMLVLVDVTERFVTLITGLESKTGLIGFLGRISDFLNPVTAIIDQLQRQLRNIDGIIRGVDPNALPSVPPTSRVPLNGASAYNLYGVGDPAARMALGLLPGLPGSPGVNVGDARAKRLSDASSGGGLTASRRASARDQAERAIARINISALQDNVETRLRDLDTATDELIKSYKVEIKARERYADSLQKLGDATSSAIGRGFSSLISGGRREFNDANRDSSRSYNLRLRNIDELFNRGALTPEQADALRQQAALGRASAINANLGGPNAKFIDKDDIQNLRDEVNLMTQLGTAISDTERFMRGFNAATISVGDAFERFGQNVSQALLNTRDLLNGLKSAVLGFFNDLLGRSLQNVARQALAPLVGLFGGGGGQSGGIGGIFGDLFRTPSTFPASVTQQAQQQSALGNFISAVSGGGSGGTAGTVGTVARSGFSLGGLFGGLASAAPLLGAGLGAGLGGQSTFGNILGAVGGGAVGLGLSFGASVFSAAGGGLGALGPAALAALGPIALIGAPLLVGAIFAGKAAQRRKDEEASGQFLTQAIQSIEQLALGVSSGSIDYSQARSIFDSQILGTFKQQISGLKTASVRESRLTNQARDLQKVYNDLVEPAIAKQIQQRRDAARFSAIDSRLVPQFDSGGLTRGGPAILHRDEMVLTPTHQASIRALAGPDIFNRVGVPGYKPSGVFDSGGIYAGSSTASSSAPAAINLVVRVGVTQNDAQQILASATNGRTGKKIIVNAVQDARGDGRAV